MTDYYIIACRMLVIMIQNLIPVFFVCHSFKKRSHFLLRAVTGVIACCLFAFFVHYLESENMYLSLVFIVLYFFLYFVIINLFSFFLYELNFRSSVVIAIISYTVQHISYLIFNLFDQFLTDHVMMEGIWSYVFIRRLTATVWLVAISILLGRRLKKNPEILLPSSYVFTFSMAAALADIAVSNGAITDRLTAPLSENLAFYSIRLTNLLACAMILVLIFNKSDQTKMEKEVEVIKQLNEERSSLYSINKETIDLINLKVHDLKHQLRELSNSSQALSKEALHEINQSLTIYDTHLKTGREALDIVLQEKGLLCKNKKISLECMVDSSSLSEVSDTDIYSLFGNILDNAIEAADQSEKKEIHLKLRKVGGLSVIYEENTYAGKIEFANGLPKTTKGDERYHGYGVRSIRYIAEKYSGAMKIEADDLFFRLTVSLENRSTEKK